MYAGITIVLPPLVPQDLQDEISLLPGIRVIHSPDWAWGRHLALQGALGTSATHVQYADLDRLLRWVETRPDEWQLGVQAIMQAECVIFGRTPTAYRTHPLALRETERISNRVFSILFGLEVDLSAGVKGFSRQAGVYLQQNSSAGKALGLDAEWPVLLYEAGYTLEMMWVEGLDWETADRFLDRAADRTTQQRTADLYDQDPENWLRRVKVAQEIITAGLEAYQRKRRL
jgi:hypothetical protein